MKIRTFSYFYPPCVGGGEVILQHQAEELARRGHDVHVHTTTYTNLNLAERTAAGTTVEGGVTVHRHGSFALPFNNPFEANAVTPGLLRDVVAEADLLVCMGYPSLHLGALTARARLTGTPLVVQNYVTAAFLEEILAGEGGLNKRVRSAYWRHLTRRALARASLVIADSPAAGRALSERLGLGNVRTHIGMAVDPAEFDGVTREARAAIRARLGLGADRIVLAPSRLSRQKGPDLLVRAMAPLFAGTPGWRLVIPGAVNEPEFAAEVRALAAPLGDRVVFGPVSRPELVALFREAEIVCLPSRGETVGGVVFEGMYSGALAIVSDAVEAARDDYVCHERNGLLVPAEDVDALRAAVARGMREDLGPVRASGRRMVEMRFTWSKSVDRLWALYEEALRAGEQRPRGGEERGRA
ncbi:MAG: glycosyltransferase family 4 protein [Pseudomonadota bacterium]|nr:glycosyltransferase family 4 protein [Pseudomonadota bacterium]